MIPHQRDAFYWSFPAAVRLSYADGRRELRPFPSRLEAETFVAIIPLLQVWGHEEAAGVTAAVVVSMWGRVGARARANRGEQNRPSIAFHRR